MKKRIAAYSVAVFGIVALWLLFIYLPLQREMDETVAEIERQDAQMQDFTSTMARLPEFLETTSSLKASRKDVSSSLYAKGDILKLLRHVSELASSQGMEVTEITPSVAELLELNRTVPDPSEPNFLNINFFLAGDYVGFGRFVEELESTPFFRGASICRIVGSRDSHTETTFQIGIRALLGNIEETA